jgi:hypothetical protein
MEYWNDGPEIRNNYAFGHEYSKGSFQVSAALGIFDGKRERIEKTNQTSDRFGSRIASSVYIPCCMFKNETFGGFVAENYRALTMLSPWIFRCLLDKEFSPPLPVLPPHEKPRDK